MKTKRFLSAVLALLMVLSSMSFVAFAADTDNALYLNESPNYVRLTDTKASLYADTYTCTTEGGATGFTFWFNVKNLYKPVYLYGTYFNFTTTDGHSFGTDTGGANLRNNGFKIDANGDYFLYVPASATSTLHWSCSADYGLFQSITNIRARACDAETFDATGEKVDGYFDIALMGIIEGQVDLSAASVQWNDADGATSLGEGAATSTLISNKAIADTSDAPYTNGNWKFYKITAPESVVANAPEGKELLGWKDANGYLTLPTLSDTMTAYYGSFEYPEDESVAQTKIAEPLSTTFGTKANVLPEAYTVQTSDLSGLTLILKVDGIPEGETATMEGINISVTSGETAPSSMWASSWVYNARNYNVFSEDGYYAYYFDFYNLDDGHSLSASVAGETTINSVTFFENSGAWTWALNKDLNDCTVNEDISIALVGIVEGDITSGNVMASDGDGNLLAIGSSDVEIDSTAKSPVWAKLTEPADVYVGDANAVLGKGLDYFADANGNKVDYVLGERTLKAVYKDVDVASYTLTLPELTPGNKGDATVTLVAVEGDADGAVAPVSGTITVTFDKNAYAINGDTDGSVTVAYDGVGENGVVATLSVAALDLAATGDYTFTVDGTAVTEKGEATIFESTATDSLETTQTANGSFFFGDVVPFNKTTTTTTTTTDETTGEVAETVTEKAPSEQALWRGDVDFGEDSIGGTFIVKVDGIETPITADRFIITADDTLMDGHRSTGCGNWVNAPAVYQLTFEKDGYYYINVNYSAMDGRYINSLEEFTVFNNSKGVNKNENATFQMLGIVQNDLKPTVKFVNPDGTEIASYTHAYTNVTGWSQQTRIGELIGADEMFALTGAEAPTYAPDDGNEYVFTGWVDAAGNPVDAIYADTTIYANYTTDTVTYEGTATDVEFGGDKTTISIDLSDDSQPVTSGKVTVTFDENVFYHKDAVDGVLTLDWPVVTEEAPAEGETETVAEGETTEEVVSGLLTVELGVTKYVITGEYTITLGGTSKLEDGTDVFVKNSTVSVNIAGQDFEGVIMNPDVNTWTDLPTDEEGLKATDIFDGYADFTAAGGVTLVYRATGINTPVDAGVFRYYYLAQDDTTLRDMNGEWAYNNTWISLPNGDWPMHAAIEKDGYYFVYLSRKVLGMSYNGSNHIGAVNKIQMFGKNAGTVSGGPTPTNTNTDAKVQVLAVLADNLQPTVNFYNGTDELLVAQQHKYSDTTNANSGNPMGDNPVEVNHAVKGELVTVEDIFAESGLAAPTKAADADGTEYFFTGWVDADGNPVDDVAVYTTQNVYAAYTTDAVGYSATATDVEFGGTSTDVTLKLDENELGVVSGTVTLTFDPGVFSHADAKDGVLTIPYEDVTEDGTIATVTLTVKSLVAGGEYTIELTGTSVDVFGNDVFVKTTAATVKIDGQQDGGYIEMEPVVLEDPSTLDNNGQLIWSGDVNFADPSANVTFVFDVKGVESTIYGTKMNFEMDLSTGESKTYSALNKWEWNNVWGGGSIFAPEVVLEEDGTYFLYMNRKVIFDDNGATTNLINGINSFYLFCNAGSYTNYTGSKRANSNENATFDMLAIVSNDLAPTVNFYNEDKTFVGSYTYTYTDIGNNSAGDKKDADGVTLAKKFGKLVSAEAVFAASGMTAPTKASDETYVYTFAGWVGEDGKPVNSVYTTQNVYATFDAIEKTTQYDVTFMNGETQFGETQKVYEKDVATAPADAPTKADDDTGYFTFAGWSLTEGGEVVDVASVQITEATTFYAVYTHTDVTYTVTYKDYNGKVIYTETVIRSQNAVYDKVPTRATDAYDAALGGGIRYTFSYWSIETVDETTGEVTWPEAVLTNVQGNIEVIAYYTEEFVTEWYDVTWVDYDGTVLDTKKVAVGENGATNQKGALNGTADEFVWYTFNGWDTETTNVTADVTAKIVYTETPVATGDMLYEKTETVTNVSVGTETVLWDTEKVLDTRVGAVTIVFDIKGASEDNPISIGGIFGKANGGQTNWCGAMPNNGHMLANVTADGMYYIVLGSNVFYNGSYEGSTDIAKMQYLAIDSPSNTRNPASIDVAGTATYDAYAFMGALHPEVRFYDENKNWLYTGKYSFGYSSGTASGGAVPTAESIYAGPEIENFEYWVDADGNEVTYVTNNMAVYAKVTHFCDFVATGHGTAKCEGCGTEKTDAFTIIADPNVELSALKAGETVTVPVVVTNGTYVGATLKVVTSDNVSVTAISVAGTAFEGYTAEFSDSIVLNAAMSGADITADGTIVYLTLTANADLAGEEQVTVQIIAEQIVNIADEDITADVADGYVATYTAVAAEEEILWGDVNGDNELTPADIMLLTRYVNKWNPNTYTDIKNPDWGDVNGDNELTPADIMLLTRFINKWNPNTYVDAKNLVGSN